MTVRLLSYRTLQTNRLAVRRDDGGFWVMEPGDMTRYEAKLVKPGVAFAWIGFDDLLHTKGIIVSDYEDDVVLLVGSRHTEYDIAVLTFFAKMVLGQDVPEPEELACRRTPTLPAKDV